MVADRIATASTVGAEVASTVGESWLQTEVPQRPLLERKWHLLLYGEAYMISDQFEEGSVLIY